MTGAHLKVSSNPRLTECDAATQRKVPSYGKAIPSVPLLHCLRQSPTASADMLGFFPLSTHLSPDIVTGSVESPSGEALQSTTGEMCLRARVASFSHITDKGAAGAPSSLLHTHRTCTSDRCGFWLRSLLSSEWERRSPIAKAATARYRLGGLPASPLWPWRRPPGRMGTLGCLGVLISSLRDAGKG